jgi:hypothetical protein
MMLRDNGCCGGTSQSYAAGSTTTLFIASLPRSAESSKEQGFMDLMLNDDDVRTLRALLHDYLPELKWDAARADAPEIRHALVKRQTLCERLLEQLRETSSS